MCTGSGECGDPAQQRLSPTDVDDLIATYQAGATISRLAAAFGVHCTTVASHLVRHRVPRHREQIAWDASTLEEAAELYAAGLSLAEVAVCDGIDAQTVANRFRRVGRPRPGWASRDHSEEERR